MRSSPLRLVLIVACMLACAACGFDWSVPEGNGGSGAGGAVGGHGGAKGGAGTGNTQNNGGAPENSTSSNDPQTSTGAVTEDCQACVLGTVDQCQEQSAACQNTEHCMDLTDCAMQCGPDSSCFEQCSSMFQPDDATWVAFQELVNCALCATCLQSCQGYRGYCT